MKVHLFRSVQDPVLWSRFFPYDTHQWWLDAAYKTKQHRLTDLKAADLVIVTDTEVGRAVYGPEYRSRLQKCLDGSRYVVYDQSDIPTIEHRGIYTSLARYHQIRGYVAQVPYVSTYTPICVNFEDWNTPRNTLWVYAGGCGLPSFLGYDIRKSILRLDDTRAVIRDTSNDSMWSVDTDKVVKRRQNQELMKAELRDSEFCVCPCGAGVSSFRLYEAMRSGCIPVIISDNWVPSIPVDWDQFSIRVCENDVQNIPEILRERREDVISLRKSLRVVVNNYLADDVVFDYQIRVANSLSLNLNFVPTSWISLLTKTRRFRIKSNYQR